MNRLQNILVPIDLTDTSRLLLDQGARLATSNGATLHVLHVIDRSTLHHFEATHGEQDLTRLEGMARREMEDLLRKMNPQGITVELSIANGHPADCILQRASTLKADLVILNAHDSRNKRLGRVASDVVRHANCKILIARDWQPGAFKRIAACVDLSDLSREVLRQAVSVATTDSAHLELVHVIYPVDRDYDIYRVDFGTASKAEYRARVEAALQKRIEEFTSPLRDDLDRLDYSTTILESTDPAVSISAYLQRSDCDLVVVGTTGHESVFGLRYGSNAERLVRDTHCSVLAIKPE